MVVRQRSLDFVVEVVEDEIRLRKEVKEAEREEWSVVDLLEATQCIDIRVQRTLVKEYRMDELLRPLLS